MSASPALAQQALVDLPCVFRASIAAAERVLLRASVGNARFGERAGLMRGLTEARVLIARFLVILRWSNKMSFTDTVEDRFAEQEAKFAAFGSELQEVSARFKIPKSEDVVENSPVIEEPVATVRVRDVFSKLFLHGIPKRMRYVGSAGRMICFSAPGEYRVVFKAAKTGVLRVSSFVVHWVKGFEMPSAIVVRLAALLRSLESNQGVLLHTLDRILHGVHVACLFAKIVREMHEKAGVFHATVTRAASDPRSVYLSYRDPIWHGGQFLVTMKRGMIICAAKNAIYESNVIDGGEGEAELREQMYKKRMPIVRLDGTGYSVDYLLSHFRDLVCASSLHMVFITVTYSLRSLFSNFPCVKKTFSMAKATLGDITVSLQTQELLRLCVQQSTGHVRIEFHNIFLPKTGAKKPITIEDVGQLYETVNVSVSNVLVNLVGVVLYGSTVNQYSAFHDTRSYYRSFSFAPDFLLSVTGKRGSPRVSIVDRSGKSYSLPEMVHMESQRFMNAWRMLVPVLICAKRFLFLAQLQRYLTELNINSILVAQYLEVEIAACRKCTVKMTENGWKVVFRPMTTLLARNIEPVSKWYGHTYTARISRMLAHLLHTYHIWRLTYESLTVLCQYSAVISSMFLTDDNQIFIQVRSRHKDILIFSFAENAIFCGAMGNVEYRECPWSFTPQLDAKCARNIPLSNYLTSTLRNVSKNQELCAFLSHDLLQSIEFHRVFSGPDWYFTDFWGFAACTLLIYKNKYSLRTAMRPYKTMAAEAPTILPSSALRACSVSFYLRYDTWGRLVCWPLNVDVSMLEVFRDMVACFCDVVDCILGHGFLCIEGVGLDYQRDDPTVTFVSKNMKVIIDNLQVRITVTTDDNASQSLTSLCAGEFEHSAFIDALLSFSQQLLAVDPKLLSIFAMLLDRLKTDQFVCSESIATAMKTVTISAPDGLWSLSFPDRNLQIQIARPFGPTSQFFIQTKDNRQMCSGIDALFPHLYATY